MELKSQLNTQIPDYITDIDYDLIFYHDLVDTKRYGVYHVILEYITELEIVVDDDIYHFIFRGVYHAGG